MRVEPNFTLQAWEAAAGGFVVTIIKQFRLRGVPPCAQRSVQLQGDDRNDTYAIGERLITLGYLRLAEKAGVKL